MLACCCLSLLLHARLFVPLSHLKAYPLPTLAGLRLRSARPDKRWIFLLTEPSRSNTGPVACLSGANLFSLSSFIHCVVSPPRCTYSGRRVFPLILFKVLFSALSPILYTRPHIGDILLLLFLHLGGAFPREGRCVIGRPPACDKACNQSINQSPTFLVRAQYILPNQG